MILPIIDVKAFDAHFLVYASVLNTPFAFWNIYKLYIKFTLKSC